MGDLGEFWRDVKAWRKENPRLKTHIPPAPVPPLTKRWAKLGFVRKSDWHWQAKVGGTVVNYWPSKFKWQIGDSVTVGTEAQLRRDLAAIMEPKP